MFCDLPVGFSLPKSKQSKMLPQHGKEMDLLMFFKELFRDLILLSAAFLKASSGCMQVQDNL